MMISEKQMWLDRIATAINNNTCMRDEIEMKLRVAIETEFTQQDHPADCDYIKQCVLLLERVVFGEHPEYNSHMEQSIEAVTAKYQQIKRIKHIRSIIVKIAAVALFVGLAICVLCRLVGN